MEGWNAVSKIRGVLLLVIFGMLLTFAIGFIQVLAGPLLLTFTSKLMLGYAQTAMALGMLLASIVVSSIAIGKNHTSILVVSIIVSAIGYDIFPY